MLVPPSPKLQFQFVTVPVELSVNCTESGAVPLVGEAVKAAAGPSAFAVMLDDWQEDNEP